MKRKRKKKAAAKLLKTIRMFPNLALRQGKRILSRFSIAVSREAEKEPFSGTYGTIPFWLPLSRPYGTFVPSAISLPSPSPKRVAIGATRAVSFC